MTLTEVKKMQTIKIEFTAYDLGEIAACLRLASLFGQKSERQEYFSDLAEEIEHQLKGEQ